MNKSRLKGKVKKVVLYSGDKKIKVKKVVTMVFLIIIAFGFIWLGGQNKLYEKGNSVRWNFNFIDIEDGPTLLEDLEMEYNFREDELIIMVDIVSNLSKLDLDFGFNLRENPIILFDRDFVNYSIIDSNNLEEFEILLDCNCTGDELKIIAKFDKNQFLPYNSYKIKTHGIILDKKVEFDLYMPGFFSESVIVSRGVNDYRIEPSNLKLDLDNSSDYKFTVISRKDETMRNLLISLGTSILAGVIVLMFQFSFSDKR